MKLIIGLGNPGKEYENTRHNVGFMIVDNYIKTMSLDTKKKFNGETAETVINNEKVIFLKPLNYMNLSGDVVREYVEYFNIKIEDILVIYDDISFEVGSYKLKKNGSSGGHNGMNNIIQNLKTENIKRLKIGISKKTCILKNYVLKKFSLKDRDTLTKVIEISESIITDFCTIDFEKLMNKYNTHEK